MYYLFDCSKGLFLVEAEWKDDALTTAATVADDAFCIDQYETLGQADYDIGEELDVY